MLELDWEFGRRQYPAWRHYGLADVDDRSRGEGYGLEAFAEESFGQEPTQD
jgi:hypothetical protein